MDTYRRRLPDMDGYVTENGRVDIHRAGILLQAIADVENDILQRRREKDLAYKQRERENRARNRAHEAEQYRVPQVTPYTPGPDKDSANASAAERLRMLLAQATNTQAPLPQITPPPPVLTAQEKISRALKKKEDDRLDAMDVEVSTE